MNIPKKHVNKNSPCNGEELNNFSSWDEVVNVINEFSSDWIFRGQSDSKWELVPSIVRALQPHEICPDSFETVFAPDKRSILIRHYQKKFRKNLYIV